MLVFDRLSKIYFCSNFLLICVRTTIRQLSPSEEGRGSLKARHMIVLHFGDWNKFNNIQYPLVRKSSPVTNYVTRKGTIVDDLNKLIELNMI